MYYVHVHIYAVLAFISQITFFATFIAYCGTNKNQNSLTLMFFCTQTLFAV